MNTPQNEVEQQIAEHGPWKIHHMELAFESDYVIGVTSPVTGVQYATYIPADSRICPNRLKLWLRGLEERDKKTLTRSRMAS